jgi:hypothetical protein
MVALTFLAISVLAFWLAEPWSLHLMPQAGFGDGRHLHGL